MAEVCDIKFSNDGKSMLLTTTNNNVYLLDAYHGEKVSFVLQPCFSVFLLPMYEILWIQSSMFHLVQKCGFNMDSSANATIEATFTPDGQYVLSGKAINFALFITFVFRSFCFC